MKRISFILLFSFFMNLVFGQVPFREIDKWGMVSLPFYEDMTEFKYDEIGFISGTSGLVHFKIKNKYGFLNLEGEEVIAGKYDEVWPFYRKVAKVRIGEKVMIIDEAGNEVFDQEYIEDPSIQMMKDLIANTRYTNAKLLEFPRNKWRPHHVALEPDSIWVFKNSLHFIPYQKNGKWGVSTYKGKDTGLLYDTLISWSKAMFFVTRGNKEGVITNDILGGGLRVLDGFDAVKRVKRGDNKTVIFFRKKNLWGYLHGRNEFVELKYRSISFVENSFNFLVVITEQGKLGYVDLSSGKELYSEAKIVKIADLELLFKPIVEEFHMNLSEDLGDKYIVLERMVDAAFENITERNKIDLERFKRSFARGSFYYPDRFKDDDVLEIGNWMLEHNLIEKDKPSCAAILVKHCKSIYRKHRELIDKLPNNLTAKAIKVLGNEKTDKRHARIINSMFHSFNNNADLNNPLNKKIFILFHFHDFVYQELVKQKAW